MMSAGAWLCACAFACVCPVIFVVDKTVSLNVLVVTVPEHWQVIVGVRCQVQVHVWLQVHVQVHVRSCCYVMDIIVFNYFQTIRTFPTNSKGLLGDLPCQGLRQSSLKFWSASLKKKVFLGVFPLYRRRFRFVITKTSRTCPSSGKGMLGDLPLTGIREKES